jgi:transcriptional regulator with XRE-family HTH domain
MISPKTTFGSYISDARKKRGISQKELAALILREDGEAISPQYLNDIERDRRNPSSDHLIGQFAEALGLQIEYLQYLVGKLPDDRPKNLSEQEVVQFMRAFRGGAKKRS